MKMYSFYSFLLSAIFFTQCNLDSSLEFLVQETLARYECNVWYNFITALVVLRGPGVEGRNLPGPVP